MQKLKWIYSLIFLLPFLIPQPSAGQQFTRLSIPEMTGHPEFQTGITILMKNSPISLDVNPDLSENIYLAEVSSRQEDFRPDSVITWQYLTPQDSVRADIKTIRYTSSGLESEIEQDTLFYIYNNDGQRYYLSNSLKYTYNEQDQPVECIYLQYGTNETVYNWDYNDANLLEKYSMSSGMDERNEYRDYYSDGNLRKDEIDTKHCQNYDFTSKICSSWKNQKAVITFYNEAGLPDSGLIVTTDTTHVTYEHEVNGEEKLTYLKETDILGRQSTIKTYSIRDTLKNGKILDYTHETFNLSVRTFFYSTKQITDYDDSGNRLSGAFYEWDMKKEKLTLIVTDSLTYDKNGILTSVYSRAWANEYSGSDHLRKFEYDSNGKLIIYSQYNRGFLDRWSPYQRQFYYQSSGPVNVPESHFPNLSIFPNPASDLMHIKFTGNEAGYTRYHICDLKGRILKSSKISGNITTDIDISDLKDGIYILYLFETGQNSSVQGIKFLKTRKF